MKKNETKQIEQINILSNKDELLEQSAEMFAIEKWEAYMRRKKKELFGDTEKKQDDEPEEKKSGWKRFTSFVKNAPKNVKNSFTLDYYNGLKEAKSIAYKDYFIDRFKKPNNHQVNKYEESESLFQKYKKEAEESLSSAKEQMNEELYFDDQVQDNIDTSSFEAMMDADMENDINNMSLRISKAHEILQAQKKGEISDAKAKKEIARHDDAIKKYKAQIIQKLSVQIRKLTDNAPSDLPDVLAEYVDKLHQHATLMLIQGMTDVSTITAELQKLDQIKIVQINALENEFKKQKGLFKSNFFKRLLRKKNGISTIVTVGSAIIGGITGKTMAGVASRTLGATLGAVGGFVLGGAARAGITYATSKGQDKPLGECEVHEEKQLMNIQEELIS